MKKEVKDLWVKALLSGKYKQTTRMLKNEDGAYCCLGVLCDISKEGEWSQHGLQGFYLSGDNTNGNGELPDAVMIYAGIDTPMGSIKFPKGYVSLVDLNDDRRRSFKQIAAFIERNWEKL